jgi:DNA-binding FrmR family transcriptional regulator
MKAERKPILTNIKKARSLLEKIAQMVEQDEYCIDIMQQNLAVIGLLKSVHQQMMEDHLHSCFSKAMDSKQEKRKGEMVEEILKVTKLVNK